MKQRTIEVVLTTSVDADILVFMLDEAHPDTYTVHLNSATSQNELKDVFSKLLQILLEEDVALKLIVADGYDRVLYKEVCMAYIDDLNCELAQVKEIMQRELF